MPDGVRWVAVVHAAVAMTASAPATPTYGNGFFMRLGPRIPCLDAPMSLKRSFGSRYLGIQIFLASMTCARPGSGNGSVDSAKNARPL